MKPLHISVTTAHSGRKPSAFISSFTHSYQVFLSLPAHLTPTTTTFLQADTQSSPLSSSTCPNHLNLPCLTTSATLWTPKDCTNPHCASYPSATPHTSISPSSDPSSPDFADSLSSLPRFQSHLSIHSGHKPCIFFPLCIIPHWGFRASAASHIALSVGELFLWKPTLTALRRNDSSWSRWAAFVNPHHAEEAYWSFEMTVAWNTVHAILVHGVRILTGQMNWWRMRRALASRSCCTVWLRWFSKSSLVGYLGWWERRWYHVNGASWI